MAFALIPGDECVINGDFSMEGRVIFRRGQIVTIRDINADPQRPGFKYVVQCDELNALVRLPGTTLKRITCPNCRGRVDFTSGNCPGCGWQDPEREGEKIQERMRDFNRRQSQRRDYNSGGDWGSPGW